MVEFEKFKVIQSMYCKADTNITEGKMMSSPAIHYKKKVFAFFSRKHKMVFKLGKSYDVDAHGFEIKAFSPFKTKAPLSGWYEVDYTHGDQWQGLAEKALKLVKLELK